MIVEMHWGALTHDSTRKYFELEIERLNREYDYLLKPVKVEREKKTRVKFVRVFCGACQREHDLGRLKITSLGEWGDFIYRCPLKNTEERAAL